MCVCARSERNVFVCSLDYWKCSGEQRSKTQVCHVTTARENHGCVYNFSLLICKMRAQWVERRKFCFGDVHSHCSEIGELCCFRFSLSISLCISRFSHAACKLRAPMTMGAARIFKRTYWRVYLYHILFDDFQHSLHSFNAFNFDKRISDAIHFHSICRYLFNNNISNAKYDFMFSLYIYKEIFINDIYRFRIYFQNF